MTEEPVRHTLTEQMVVQAALIQAAEQVELNLEM
jgi:hypothetical protein